MTYAIPGVSVAIVFSDGSVWRGRSGLADVAARRPVTADTAFSVASVSKTFTAALIMRLVEDGRLTLETRARTILPTLRIDPTITVRQLLDHTSGLRDFYLNPRIDKALLAKRGQVWDATRSLGYVGKPFARPGHVVALLEHELPRARHARRSRRSSPAGRPAARRASSRRSGSTTRWYQAAEAPKGPVAHGYRFTGKGLKLRRDRPVGWLAGRAVHLGHHGVRRRRLDRQRRPSDLARWAGRAVRRQRPQRRVARGDDRGHRADRAAQAGDPVRPRRPGASRSSADRRWATPVGSSGSRAVMRWIPAERIAIAVVTNQSRTDPALLLADLAGLALTPPPRCLACPTP